MYEEISEEGVKGQDKGDYEGGGVEDRLSLEEGFGRLHQGCGYDPKCGSGYIVSP